MAKTREEIPNTDKWNVEALYPNLKAWQKDYDAISHEGQRPRWPEVSTIYKGRLGENATLLKEALVKIQTLDRQLSKLFTYAHLRHDEEIANHEFKSAHAKITALLHEFNQETSWFEPELLALPETTLNDYLKSPFLQDYRFHLEKILRLKPHTLSGEQEEIMALAGQALDTPYKTFNALSDADFVFGKVKDSQGEEHEVTHASHGLYLREQDRVLRENAFKCLHSKYLAHENTFNELLSGQVKKACFYSRAKHYSNCMEAALFPKNIDTGVYHALIQAVDEEITTLHRYVKLRQKILKLDQLHLYDMYVPLTSQIDLKIPYEEAENLIIESVAPLGTDYQSLLKEGLKNQRWVDRYENKNKRSGAYSSGCFDSMPYILMNYKGIIRDVFTLAHEAGHSMHSLLSNQSQPYHYSNYPIFLAEVASTFNEELLFQLLLQRAKSKEEKIFLINQKIEDIRGTLFRQTMFAEFELLIHEKEEKNEPLTPVMLKEEYLNLNKRYFGPDVIIDKEAEIEWARIPHFYYNFYVFQYATGISAALSLADQVTKGGEKEKTAYLTFLKSGSSDYPIEILKKAGIDMRTPQPVKTTIAKFGALIEELEKLAVE